MGLETKENQYLSGRTVLNCSDVTAAEIDQEVMMILKDSYEEAKRLLMENRDALWTRLPNFLIEKETITGKEFMKIFRKVKGLPEPEEKTAQDDQEVQSVQAEKDVPEEPAKPSVHTTADLADIPEAGPSVSEADSGDDGRNEI